MSWYDDDETEVTSGGNDDFGFFDNSAAETGTDTPTENADSSSDASGPIGKFKNRIGKKNFAIILAMFIGMFIIIGVVLIFGKEDKPAEEKVTPTPVVQQQTQQQQTQQKPVTSTSDWKDVTGATFEPGVTTKSQFNVTEYKMYMRTAGTGALEVRVEVSGSIDGYSGTYKLDVPYGTIAAIKQYEQEGKTLSFPVTISVGKSKDNKVIYDITP